MIYTLGDRTPTINAKNYFVADNATIIGTVVLEENSSVWFGTVIRGDCDIITIGPESNVQDCAVLHSDPGIPLTLGKGVTVGHHAMLHGCDIGDYSLIGIHAVVLNGAKIGKNCIIGANALVTENMLIPDNSLVMGSPAKVIKQLNEKQVAMIKVGAEHYAAKIPTYHNELKPFDEGRGMRDEG
jgi:carbonic anhydrase/acetyltransferase-like protein (isoleucine patch superfamily)